MSHSRLNIVHNCRIVIATAKYSLVAAVNAQAENVALMLLQHHLHVLLVVEALLDVPEQNALVVATCDNTEQVE